MAEAEESHAQDQLTRAQLEAIERNIRTTQPLTSPLLPVSVLEQQYNCANDTGESDAGARPPQQQQASLAGFRRSAAFLAEKYTSIRRVRGDGNCYYRAFLYSLCEQLLRRLFHPSDDGEDLKEFRRMKDLVAGSLPWVCRYGYDEYTIDMFHEELVGVFELIEEVSSKAPAGGEDGGDRVSALRQLHDTLNEENAASDYCTWFMRVLTAAQMKSAPDDYLPFLLAENYTDVSAFCAREVEPMAKECGMVQVAALAERLGVRVVIEYVDGRLAEGEKLAHHVFGEGGTGDDRDCNNGGGRVTVTLLYRPGHYDILYR